MAKNPLLNIATIFGTIGIVAIGIFCYIFHNTAIAVVPTTVEINPNSKPLIKTPQNLSYPSSHSSKSPAAIKMDHYFPENKTEWDKTATEIGHSRLWGCVHFPIDDSDGLELGKKIGDWIVSKIKHQ
jgi:membrane-associated phospholipid phosphatase